MINQTTKDLVKALVKIVATAERGSDTDKIARAALQGVFSPEMNELMAADLLIPSANAPMDMFGAYHWLRFYKYNSELVQGDTRWDGLEHTRVYLSPAEIAQIASLKGLGFAYEKLAKGNPLTLTPTEKGKKVMEELDALGAWF